MLLEMFRSYSAASINVNVVQWCSWKCQGHIMVLEMLRLYSGAAENWEVKEELEKSGSYTVQLESSGSYSGFNWKGQGCKVLLLGMLGSYCDVKDIVTSIV